MQYYTTMGMNEIQPLTDTVLRETSQKEKSTDLRGSLHRAQK